MATTGINSNLEGMDSLECRRELVQKTKDPQILADLALNDEFWEIRREATSKISNQKILEKIASTDEFWQVRFEAVSKIKSQEFLAKIIKSDNQVWVCKEAVCNLYDSDLLSDIILDKEIDMSVRTKAIKQLNELDVLTSLRPKVESELQPNILQRIREIQGY